MSDDLDLWDEEDWQDDEINEVISCPNCEAEVYEDAEQCPVCGEYILRENRLWEDKPGWWVVLGVAGIVATVIVLAGLGAVF